MEISKIIEKSYEGEEVSKAECIELLKLDNTSKEAFQLRAAATDIVRKRNGNSGYIFAQIGLECEPCEGDCSFCSFAKSHTNFKKIVLDEETIINKVKDLDSDGSLYGLYLMTTAKFNLDNFLANVKLVKSKLRGPTKIFSNVGDSSYDDFREMKKAGINGAYHCWRLGEGKDTTLKPETRKQTIENAKEAGLEVLDALEPIGIEHTPQEIADHIFFSKENNVLQSGAMKRINVPGTPFESKPELEFLTLSKYEAAMVLVFSSMKRMPIMGIHEPDIIGYTSGANMISAEAGVNPRDIVVDTEKNRGWDFARCKSLLTKAGFSHLMLGNDSRVKLGRE